ncbi:MULTISPECIES: hypothetical protein [Latilactobacillus]|uniref:Uncharacterized protein n=1 Tax=Latilactobacillus curvatus TaxID=28038 RepID=A0AAJ5RI43_LATCU|nr:hypothetical protein [Latilactobacillus curvatus]EHE85137.1 hypothetical protein CRL705_1795 [Latilactobacillus curvatus CRL 705]KHO13279.1 hypothetical protein OA78_0687 [Latilactobacillus curvatus]MBZ1505580.1 hypothetical protein [Latilactobacillus curvatus]MCP8847507.1 hypothetical protein [Latilactobacillus curvatus]MCP8859874.1 hypothetical protein [Latilactobacillus curvatus]
MSKPNSFRATARVRKIGFLYIGANIIDFVDNSLVIKLLLKSWHYR